MLQESQALLKLLRSDGIANEVVLRAMEMTPRHLFVGDLQTEAYHDKPLAIGFGQTISQPRMVAAMTSALKLRGTEKVLEIGTGSGYQAAVLARLTAHLYTVERIAELSLSAQQRLRGLGLTNVTFAISDGSRGWPEASPLLFDAIIVTCAAPTIPPPLLSQLALQGRLVIPVAAGDHEKLTRVTRLGPGSSPAAFKKEELMNCTFVPLIGAYGYSSS